MTQLVFPGATWDPGAASGYAFGVNRMELVVEHFTVGVNSFPIGKRGYFHTLFPKVGPPIQFAEINAVTWHAGPHNPRGPGHEFERLGYQEPLTDDQIGYGRDYHLWLHEEHGFPLSLYDGPKLQVPSDYRGFVNHGDLDKDRTDGVTREEWAALTAQTEEFDMLIIRTSDGKREAVIGSKVYYFRSLDARPAAEFLPLDADEWDYLHNDLAATVSAATGGVTGPLPVTLTGTVG